MVRGSCLCGGVRFEADETPVMTHCHCSQCRKARGAAFGSYAHARTDQFRFTNGEDLVRTFFTRRASWSSCGRCGGSVPATANRTSIPIPAGTLDDDPGVRPALHIWTGSKAPWWEIQDELPRFEDWLPGYVPEGAGPVEHTVQGPASGPVRGSCLCGSVGFEADAIAMMSCCHCSMCRKKHGSAFSTMAHVRPEQFRLTRGAEGIGIYRTPRGVPWGSCTRCGSPVPVQEPDFGSVAVPAGALDDDPGVRPSLHIWTGSKAPWWEIRDDLPKFESWVPGYEPDKV